MDGWAALTWQLALGADEALETVPSNRLTPAAPRAAATPVPSRPPAAAPATAAAWVQAVQTAAALAAAADSLAALREAIAQFEGCALRTTATRPVFAEGDPATGLLLIGGAPEEADDRTGRPFAGPAGEYLDRMLRSIALDRARVMLAPLVPWRPPGDRPPSVAERAACRPFLDRLIVLLRPRLIVLLGPLPVQDLLGAGGARRGGRGGWRALTVPPLDPVPTLASQDPGFLGRNPGPARRRAWADLRLLRRTMDEDITKS